MSDRQALIEDIGAKLEESGVTVYKNARVTTDGEIIDSDQHRNGQQAQMRLCMTCGRLEEDHGEEYELCAEFWPLERKFEDGLEVLGHEVGITGAVEIALRARVPQELWDSMTMDNEVRVTLDCVVVGKGVKAHKSDGEVVGLIEQRKLKAQRIVVTGAGG